MKLEDYVFWYELEPEQMLHAASQVLWKGDFPNHSALVLPLEEAINWLKANKQTDSVVISIVNESAWMNLCWKRPLAEAIGSILYSEAVGRKGVFLDGLQPPLILPGPKWTIHSSAFGNRLYYII